MHIVLIGSGNVATVLGRLLKQKGHRITQVYSRSLDHTTLLATELEAAAVAEPATLDTHADLWLLAVSDNALPGIRQWLPATRALVAHTAGSVSREVLQGISNRYGVFYPLQTLKKQVSPTPGIPFLVDGNTEETRAELFDLAASLSNTVRYAGDAERKKLHLAAVIVNNFSNHLYVLAEQFCRDEGVDFQLLMPIIAEGASRIAVQLPALLQTGPAIRNDTVTLDRHRELLLNHPALLHMYELFTESIRQRAGAGTWPS